MGASVFAAVEVVLLARFLGLDQFGLFSLVISYVRFINNFVDLKISEASIKYISEYREKNDKERVRCFIKFFYLIDFLSGVVAFVLCIALAGVANSLFIKSGESFQYVLILSSTLLISTVNQNSHAILQSLKKFRESALFRVFQNFLRITLISVAFFLGFGLKGFFVAYLATAFINFAVLQISVHRTLRDEQMDGWVSANLGKIRNKMKEAAWFIMNTAISSSAYFSFSAHLPILLLGYFSGTEASGLYKVARSVARVLDKISGPVYSVVYPALARLGSNEAYKEIRKLIIYSLKELMKFLLPVSIAFFIFADLIIKIAFGDEYLPASDALRVLVIAFTLARPAFWTPVALLALGRPGIRTIYVIFSGCVTSVAMLMLVQQYSYMGAAYASFVTMLIEILMGAFVFLYIRQRERLSGETSHGKK